MKKQIFKVLGHAVALILYNTIAMWLYVFWTKNSRTLRISKVAIIVLLILLELFLILLVFREKFIQKIRIVLLVVCFMIFVSVNGYLSWNSLKIYSIQAFPEKIPLYSSYLPPDGDLSIIIELCEGRQVILNRQGSNIESIIKKISDYSYNDENIRTGSTKRNFIDMGTLSGMYATYGPYFNLKNENNDTVPHVYVEPFDNLDKNVVIIVDENENGDVYIYAK